jgi:hypothetical protein
LIGSAFEISPLRDLGLAGCEPDVNRIHLDLENITGTLLPLGFVQVGLPETTLNTAPRSLGRYSL